MAVWGWEKALGKIGQQHGWQGPSQGWFRHKWDGICVMSATANGEFKALEHAIAPAPDLCLSEAWILFLRVFFCFHE